MTHRVDLQSAFEQAAELEFITAVKLLPGPEAAEILWRWREVAERAEAARRQEKRLHSTYFKMRMEAQMKAIRDDDKAPLRDFEPEGYGGAKFDERAVEHEARRRVEYGHQRRMTRIDRAEAEVKEALKKKAQELVRNLTRVNVKFNEASHGRKRRRRRGIRRLREEGPTDQE